jgi:hypothetical protein
MKSSEELKKEYNALILQMALADDLEEECEQLEEELAKRSAGEIAEADAFFQRTEQRTRALINQEIRKLKLRRLCTQSLPKVGRAAAILVLVVFVGLTTAVATVRPVRVKVLQLLVSMDDPRFAELSLVAKEGAEADVPPEWKGSFYPVFIPEGFRVDRIESLTAEHHVWYENEVGERFNIVEAGVDTFSSIDTERAKVSTIAVNGTFGVLSSKPGSVIIAWAFQDKYFIISGNLDETTAMQVAESIVRIF